MTRRQDRLEHFARLARQRGLSLTVQRCAIFETVLGRTDHPTAYQIYDDAKRRIPGVARTTVYRALETLVAIGAITRASSPGSAGRYDPTTERHHHLSCLDCDTLIDLDDGVVGKQIKLPSSRARAFEIHDYSIHFRGICAACRMKRDGRRRTDGAPSTAGSRSRARRGGGDRVLRGRRKTKARKPR